MLFDLYSQFIRANVTAKKTNQLIGKSNWVQYQARIVTMISVVLLTYCFERDIININILELLSVAFLISGFVGLSYVKLKTIFNVFNYFLELPTYLTFKKFYGEKYYNFTKLKINKIFFYSLFVNCMINMAIVLPFVLAENNPEIRMTAVYIGQLLNFLASIINFNLIEPAFYKALDAQSEGNITTQIISSKIVSSPIISIIIIVLF